MTTRPRSLRTRLAITLALGVALILFVGSSFLVVCLHGAAERDFDVGLMQAAHQLASLCEQENGTIEFDYVARFHSQYEREDNPDYFQIELDDGSTLLRSAHLDEDLRLRSGSEPTPTIVQRRLASGRMVRVAHFRFTPKQVDEGASEPRPASAEVGMKLVIAVARGRERLDTLTSSLTVAVSSVSLVVLSLVLAYTWWSITKGTAPLSDLARQVARMSPADPVQRVRLDRPPGELQPVVTQFNAFAQRLHEAMQQQQRFAGNVAHELRTPVAELRSLAQVGSRWPEDANAVRDFFVDIDTISARMESVIRNLLLIARFEAGREAIATDSMPMASLVNRLWHRHSEMVIDKGLDLETDISESVAVVTDPDKLEIVVDNLIANAIAYATERTTVQCGVRIENGVASLSIRNRAAELSAEDLQRLVEPFWRRDQARVSPLHAGLGLTLASSIVKLLGLDLKFEQSSDGLFTVTIHHLHVTTRSGSAALASSTTSSIGVHS